jgi:hypothetical protein
MGVVSFQMELVYFNYSMSWYFTDHDKFLSLTPAPCLSPLNLFEQSLSFGVFFVLRLDSFEISPRVSRSFIGQRSFCADESVCGTQLPIAGRRRC